MWVILGTLEAPRKLRSTSIFFNSKLYRAETLFFFPCIYYCNITFRHLKFIDRNTYVLTPDVSTDVCAQLLNSILDRNTAPPTTRLNSLFYAKGWQNESRISLSLDRPSFMPLHLFSLYNFLHAQLLSLSPPSPSPLSRCTMRYSTMPKSLKSRRSPSWGLNCFKIHPLHNAQQAPEI